MSKRKRTRDNASAESRSVSRTTSDSSPPVSPPTAGRIQRRTRSKRDDSLPSPALADSSCSESSLDELRASRTLNNSPKKQVADCKTSVVTKESKLSKGSSGEANDSPKVTHRIFFESKSTAKVTSKSRSLESALSAKKIRNIYSEFEFDGDEKVVDSGLGTSAKKAAVDSRVKKPRRSTVVKSAKRTVVEDASDTLIADQSEKITTCLISGLRTSKSNTDASISLSVSQLPDYTAVNESDRLLVTSSSVHTDVLVNQSLPVLTNELTDLSVQADVVVSDSIPNLTKELTGSSSCDRQYSDTYRMGDENSIIDINQPLTDQFILTQKLRSTSGRDHCDINVRDTEAYRGSASASSLKNSLDDHFDISKMVERAIAENIERELRSNNDSDVDTLEKCASDFNSNDRVSSGPKRPWSSEHFHASNVVNTNGRISRTSQRDISVDSEMKCNDSKSDSSSRQVNLIDSQNRRVDECKIDPSSLRTDFLRESVEIQRLKNQNNLRSSADNIPKNVKSEFTSAFNSKGPLLGYMPSKAGDLRVKTVDNRTKPYEHETNQPFKFDSSETKASVNNIVTHLNAARTSLHECDAKDLRTSSQDAQSHRHESSRQTNEFQGRSDLCRKKSPYTISSSPAHPNSSPAHPSSSHSSTASSRTIQDLYPTVSSSLLKPVTTSMRQQLKPKEPDPISTPQPAKFSPPSSLPIPMRTVEHLAPEQQFMLTYPFALFNGGSLPAVGAGTQSAIDPAAFHLLMQNQLAVAVQLRQLQQLQQQHQVAQGLRPLLAGPLTAAHLLSGLNVGPVQHSPLSVEWLRRYQVRL